MKFDGQKSLIESLKTPRKSQTYKEEHNHDSSSCDDKEFAALNRRLTLVENRNKMASALSTQFGKGLQSKRSMLNIDKTTQVKKGISRKYTSRRTMTFDNNESGDDEAYNDTGAITFKDT